MVGVWARVSGAKRKSAAVRRSFCNGPPVMVEVRFGGWGCSVMFVGQASEVDILWATSQKRGVEHGLGRDKMDSWAIIR